MGKDIKIFILALLSLVAGNVLWSQTGIDFEKTLIYSYVETDDAILHAKTLSMLKERWKNQGYLDEDLMKVLTGMATSSIRSEVYEDGILIKTNQEVQIDSIVLLGEIGGQPALDTMTELLDKCEEYSILIEAVNSSAHIEAEEYSNFLKTLTKAMNSQHYASMDNAFAYVSLYTLNSLLENYNTVLTPELIKVVILYYESAYIHKVRDLARNVLMKY